MTINTLKGMKSCHTGINRTVGWNVPVGYLVESGRLSVMGCDVLRGEGLAAKGFSHKGSAFPLIGHPLPRLTFTAPFKEQHSPHSPGPSGHLVGDITPSSLLAGLVLHHLNSWLVGSSRHWALILASTAQPSTGPTRGPQSPPHGRR